MRKSFIFLFFILSISFSDFASVSKVQQYLNLAEYEKAKMILDKAFEKNQNDYTVHFLFAKYYFELDNKAYHVDSAYKFICLSSASLPEEDDKLYLKNLKYGYSKSHIELLKKDIQEEAYFAAEREKKIEAYNHFLSIYDDSYFRNLAIKHRDDFAFDEAKGKMDFMSFKEFMDKYPNANQAKEARSLYEKLLFENVEKEATWQAYKRYLDNYPDAFFRDKAKQKYESLLFDQYASGKDIKQLYAFICQYPMNTYRNEAEKLLFKNACFNHDTKTLLSFITLYPKSNLIHHVWKMIYVNETYEDIDSIYHQFLVQYPEYPFKDEYRQDSIMSKVKYVLKNSNEKFEFRDANTDSIVSPITFYDAQDFSGRLCAVSDAPAVNEHFKYGFINKEFKMIIPALYDEVYDFEYGYAIVGTGNCPDGSCLYGIINELGDTILPLIYQDVHEWYNHRALVEIEGGNIGYINTAGNFVIAANYKKGRNFSEGMAAVFKDTAWIFIDTNGTQKIDKNFYACTDFKNTMASFSNDGNLWGVIDYSGKIVKEAQFKEPVVFEQESTRVKLEEKIEKKNKIQYVLTEYNLFKDGRMEKVQ